MQQPLDLYLIRTRKHRYVLFGAPDIVQQREIDAGDRIRRFIQWVTLRPNRLLRWIGRMLRSAHDYYVKLEDRIDPVERVLKAISGSSELVVHYAPGSVEGQVRERFRSILRRQRLKHGFWIAVDSLISVAVVLATPILAPIPGPNVFFYYPVLRLLSHWTAVRGAGCGLGSMPVQFKSLPDLSTLEENLQTPRGDRAAIRGLAERLQIRGLDRFLERMV